MALWLRSIVKNGAAHPKKAIVYFAAAAECGTQ